jgi:hypothetical protein
MNGKGLSLLAPSGGVPALLVAAVLILAAAAPSAFATAQQPAPADAATIPADQLDSLVAPIALYPDPLLAQVLAASTYPIEIVQLQQWLTKNPGLKDEALTKAVEQQPWDASVQALAGMPDVVKRLSDDIQWTTNLGNAFLAQQSDVMAAVQRMRSKAKSKGALESTPQQVVETKTVESQQVIVIEQANPQVVYVPSYNPTVVYGPPVYPYPPVYYPPPPPPGSMLLSFGVGMAMGAMMSGGWGYGCGWGHSNTVVINNNNTYVRNQNVRTGNAGGAGNNWQHNGAHRGGTPYPNASTANRYGGTTRGASTANRQANAQQQIARQGGGAGDRSGAGGGGGARQGGNASDRSAAGGARQSAGVSDRSAPGGGGGARASASDRSASAGGAGDRASAGGGGKAGGGQDRIGSRDLSSSSGRDQRSGFGGGSDGFSGSRAQETSSRGASSRGSRSGGGGRRK